VKVEIHCGVTSGPVISAVFRCLCQLRGRAGPQHPYAERSSENVDPVTGQTPKKAVVDREK
jgi:hypothetical protein